MREQEKWPEQESDLTGSDSDTTSHLQAVHVLTVSGVDDHTVHAHRDKVAGRPQGEVRDLAASLTQAKPEQHAHILTQFAKGRK